MCLERCVLDLACLVCSFYNSVCFSKCFVYISDESMVGCRNIVQDVTMERELVYYFSFSLIPGQLLVVFIQIVRSA